jgi:hypothetical protein
MPVYYQISSFPFDLSTLYNFDAIEAYSFEVRYCVVG